MSLGTGRYIAYLVAAVFFILALKGLSNPKKARIGNIGGAIGMLIALVMVFTTSGLHNLWEISLGMVVGVVVGVPAARLVKMTAMPQMVAAFNGVGGAAAALVSIMFFSFIDGNLATLATYKVFEVIFGVVIGSVSFTGSIVAFLKLQEIMPGRPVTYRGQQAINGVIGLAILGCVFYVLVDPTKTVMLIVLLLALVFGVIFTLPIGGADAPVLISLLNSFTGLSVAATGFTLQSIVLIVAGTLVGASGTLLTMLMSQAMGRSIPNILFSAFGSKVTASGAMDKEGRSVKSGTAEDIGTLLAYSSKVAIVPGYGLAVAQAQHVARELAQALEKKGIEVFYGIHPVAGRMPGHMNVLLAEADVPYEELKEMDSANSEMSTVDVVLVVGANDVVNPAAKTSPGSPIYGMPIIEVNQARTVVFLKRSMRPGFAGIDNDLLYDEKTTMLFGDAKESLTKLVGAVNAA